MIDANRPNGSVTVWEGLLMNTRQIALASTLLAVVFLAHAAGRRDC